MKIGNIWVNIVIIDKETDIEDSIKSSLCYPDVKIKINTVESFDYSKIADTEFYIFISRNEDALCEVLDHTNVFYSLYTIFCGETENESLLDEVSDIWPENESEKMRSFRMKRFMSNMYYREAKWLYENFLMTMIDNIPELVWFKDVRGSHVVVNNAFCNTVHKDRSDIEGRGHYYIWDISPEEYSDGEYVCMESEAVVMESGKPHIFEEPVKTREGLKHFITYKTPIYGKNNKVMGTVGVAHDISNFSNMGIQLSLLIENIPLPLVICGTDGKVMQVNSYFREQFELGGNDLAEFDYKKFKEELLVPVGEPKINEKNNSVTQEFTADVGGKKYCFVLVEQIIKDYFLNSAGTFCLFHDVTVERKYESQILEAANTDELTKLYNRRYFYSYLKKNIGNPITLLYMDLDHFKEVNDIYGHSRGDDVLKRTAVNIKHYFEGDAVFRVGGDEFAVVIKGEPEKSVIDSKCRELERSVKEMFRKGGLNVSVSIGCVHADGAVVDIDEFIHNGDKDMYRIKQQHHADMQ